MFLYHNSSAITQAKNIFAFRTTPESVVVPERLIANPFNINIAVEDATLQITTNVGQSLIANQFSVTTTFGEATFSITTVPQFTIVAEPFSIITTFNDVELDDLSMIKELIDKYGVNFLAGIIPEFASSQGPIVSSLEVNAEDGGKAELNTIKKLKNLNFYYGDTAQFALSFVGPTGVAMSIADVDVDLSVSRERNPALGSNPLFSLRGVPDTANTNTTKMAISLAQWQLLQENDFTSTGRARLFYDIQFKDRNAETNVKTIGKGRFNVEKDITR